MRRRVAAQRAASTSSWISTWFDLVSKFPNLGLTRSGRFDPDQQRRAMIAFTARNAAQFKSLTGRDPRPSESYLCHFLGCGTAVKIVQADPKEACINVVGAPVIRANPSIKGMSCGALMAWARSKVPDTLDPNAPVPPLAQRIVGSTEDLNSAELRKIQGGTP